MNYRDQISNSVHPRRTRAQDWHTELLVLVLVSRNAGPILDARHLL
jgi:hypothetical protein